MRLSVFLAAPLAAALFFALPQEAEAGLDACGDIYIEAGVECEVVPPGVECVTQCTPVSFEATCAAEIRVDCTGGCTGEASVSCTGQCDTSCQAQCEINPGSFDCATYCSADCVGNCDASCNNSECAATCEANCSASCDTECNVVPASADCMASCSGSCQGSCTAESTLDCHVSCSSDLYTDCKTRVQGGCETDCEAMEGALFCDGQYVDVAGDLGGCVDALKSLFDIEVDGYADASCDGDTCTASAGASCSVGDSRQGATTALLLFGILFFGVRTRRRNQG